MTQAYVPPLTIDANRLPVLDSTIRIDLRSTIERLVALGEALQVGRGSAVSRADIWVVSGATAIRVCVANTTCKPFELRVR